MGSQRAVDFNCSGEDGCSLKDNYTDVHKRGDMCATFGIPVYNRPDGKPIGVLATDIPFVQTERYQGYTFVFFTSEASDVHLMPYNAKDLRECG